MPRSSSSGRRPAIPTAPSTRSRRWRRWRRSGGSAVTWAPGAGAFSSPSDSVDISAVGDAMDAHGWHLDRQQMPPKLHMVVTLAHQGIAPQFLADLRESVDGIATEGPAPGGSAAMYGALGSMPDRGSVDRVIRDFLDSATESREDPQPAEKP